MPNITLSVPKDLKDKMDKEKEVNWSEVARNAIKMKLSQIKILESISSRSNLTEEDALEIGRKINESMHNRYE